MPRAAFDDRLQSLFARSAERLTHYAPKHPRAVTLKALVLELLAEAAPPHAAAADRVDGERRDALQAAQDARAAETRAEEAYEALYYTSQSRLFALRASEPATAAALQGEIDRTLTAWAPSQFRALGLDRTLDALAQTLPLVGRLLPPDDATLVAAAEALQRLREARTQTDRETGEGVEALKALEGARDEARVAYVAARRILQAAFLLDGRDDLARFMPTFHQRSAAPGEPQPGLPDDPGIDAPEV